MQPKLTLFADTASTEFPHLLAAVRQACDAVFDDPYKFEITHRELSRKSRDPRPGPRAALRAEANNIARNLPDCTDPEALILRLLEFKKAAVSVDAVREALRVQEETQ
jgi:hypothetical protein